MKYLDFIAAGQKCGAAVVFLTLMATILGASATLGVAAKAETIGFPAAWWLFSGAAGLALQGLVLSARIRESGARTLPELAGLKVGPAAQRLVAAVIGVSWPAVVAAQLVAFASLWNAIAGTGGMLLPVVICATTVVLYTLAGGQRAVVRTDGPQMVILAVGFCGLFLWVFTGRCGGEPVPTEAIRLFSPDFGLREAALSLLTVGGAYFLGPDIASRSLVARDGRTAGRALVGGDIIGILLKAYSVYTPGVVCPLAVAVIAGRAERRLWLAAVAVGGLCGLAGAIIPHLDIMPTVGMGISLVLALCPVPGTRRES